MHFTRALAAVTLLFAGAQAALLDIGSLEVSVLENGTLIDLGLYANIIGEGSCEGSNVGLSASVLDLVKICACVNLLSLNDGEEACPSCPTNAHAICGNGQCACECDSTAFATAEGTCVSYDNCASPNTLVNAGSTRECQCATGYVSDGNGGCTSAQAPGASALARRQLVNFAAKVAGTAYEPFSSRSSNRALACPAGETACPLPSGDFECVDTLSALDSCGGCLTATAADEKTGQDCLAIPGALNVQCVEGQCVVASCFRGWRLVEDGNGFCV
ncbi:hypothetical protein JCM10213_002587 [Rhodosporidiobolus nylandii]